MITSLLNPRRTVLGLLLAGLLLAGLLPCEARASTEFLNDKAFQYGMNQLDAVKLIYGERSDREWEIAYDIATTSTWEIACRHHEEVMYVVRFFNGRCIYVEKRAELESKDMEKTISELFDRNGPTGEVAGNRKESQFFARWTVEERSMELMAMRRRAGLFLLSYQDCDEALNNEAMLVRDREIKQGRMVIDPVTGLAVPHVGTGEDTAQDEEGEPAQDEDPEAN